MPSLGRRSLCRVCVLPTLHGRKVGVASDEMDRPNAASTKRRNRPRGIRVHFGCGRSSVLRVLLTLPNPHIAVRYIRGVGTILRRCEFADRCVRVLRITLHPSWPFLDVLFLPDVAGHAVLGVAHFNLEQAACRLTSGCNGPGGIKCKSRRRQPAVDPGVRRRSERHHGNRHQPQGRAR